MSTLQSLMTEAREFDARKADFQVRAAYDDKGEIKHDLTFLPDGTVQVNDLKPQYPGTNGSMYIEGSERVTRSYAISDNFLSQLYEKLGAAHYGKGSNKALPVEFMSKLDAPMRAELLNWELKRTPQLGLFAEGTRWLLRTYDARNIDTGEGSDNARALLAWGYPRVRNEQVLNILHLAFEEGAEAGKYSNFKLVSPTITPDSVIVRGVWQDDVEHAQVKGRYKVGFVVRNDETGGGKFEFMPLLQRTSCENSTVLGAAQTGIGFAINHYEGASVEALIAQFTMNMQPVLGASGDLLNKVIIAEANQLPDFARIIEGLTIADGWKTNDAIVEALNAGAEGSRTQMAAVNAVTWAAHTIPSIDPVKRLSMEMLGGKLLTAQPHVFAQLAEIGKAGKMSKALAF